MKTMLMLALLAALTLGQQQNSPGASLTLLAPPLPTPGQTYPLNVFTLLVSGTPGQPFMLFVVDGPPWYGAIQIPQGSVDLAPWSSPLGIVLLAEGTVGAGWTTTLVSGPAIQFDVSIQAAVWDPLAANGFTLTQAIHIAF